LCFPISPSCFFFCFFVVGESGSHFEEQNDERRKAIEQLGAVLEERDQQVEMLQGELDQLRKAILVIEDQHEKKNSKVFKANLLFFFF
jgi:septal ring factor EnvC (AmiA/AmiB activator)